jgi:hypothetical protein
MLEIFPLGARSFPTQGRVRIAPGGVSCVRERAFCRHRLEAAPWAALMLAIVKKPSEQILDFVIDQCELKGFVSNEAVTIDRMFRIENGVMARDENGNPIIDRTAFQKVVAEKTISDGSGIQATLTVRVDGIREEATKAFEGTSSLAVTFTGGAKAKSIRFMCKGGLVAPLPDGRQ